MKIGIPRGSIPRFTTPPPIVRPGFSLVELLAVISIIGILLGLAFPAFQAVRQAARKTQCASNLHQISLSVLAYEGSHQHFPAADNGSGVGFFVLLLPLLEADAIYSQSSSFNQSTTLNQSKLGQLSDFKINVYLCPAANPADDNPTLTNPKQFTTHYYGIAGPIGTAIASDGSRRYSYRQLSPVPSMGPVGLQGIFSPTRNGQFAGRKIKDIRDGMSNTICLGEMSGSSGLRLAPIQRRGWAFGVEYESSGRVSATYDSKSIRYGINSLEGQLNDLPLSSNHPKGTNVAFIDGSVRFIDERISVNILKAISSIDGQEQEEDLDQY